MQNTWKSLILGALLTSMTACSGGSSATDGSSTASTFSVSGTLELPATVMSSDVQVNNVMKLFSAPDNSGLAATQCSDSYYYQVYCMTFTDPVVAKTGNVTCSGTTGGFTVSGLPVNEGIGCYVRRSTDGGTNYSTLGTIEIPAASLTGTSSTIATSGDIGVTVAISATGEISTTITSGAANLTETTPTTDSIKLSSGFYKIKCGETTSTEFDLVACKCRNSDTSTAYPGMNSEDACMADNASLITLADTEQFIELNLYTATTDAAMNVGNGKTIAAGTAIPVISVWGAQNATTSGRGAGGEGASASLKDESGATVNLTWSSAQATNAIAWTTGANAAGGVTADLAAPPAFNANAGLWIAWIQGIMDDPQTTGFNCSWSTVVGPNVASDYGGCIAEFAERVLRNRDWNLPRFHVQRLCDNGCEDTPSNLRIYVEGVEFNYPQTWAKTDDNSAVTVSHVGVAPKTNTRYLFEPFEATPDGGGGVREGNGWNRGYRCATAAAVAGGAVVDLEDAACTGEHNWLDCSIREETAIRFVPTTTVGTHKVIFDTKQTVQFAKLEKWTGGTRTAVSNAAIFDLCVNNVGSSESKFFMDAVKQ